MHNNFMAELECEMPEVIQKLDRNQIPAGENVSGSFFFWREMMKHTDTILTIEFVRRAQLEDEVIEQKIDEFTATTAHVNDESQIVQVPFVYSLSKWLPVSTHAVRYYFRPVRMDSWFIPIAEKYVGLQPLLVLPNQEQAQMIQTLQKYGFQEKLDSRFWNGTVQSFDFIFPQHHRRTCEFSVQFQQTKEDKAQIELVLEDLQTVEKLRDGDNLTDFVLKNIQPCL